MIRNDPPRTWKVYFKRNRKGEHWAEIRHTYMSMLVAVTDDDDINPLKRDKASFHFDAIMSMSQSCYMNADELVELANEVKHAKQLLKVKKAETDLEKKKKAVAREKAIAKLDPEDLKALGIRQ